MAPDDALPCAIGRGGTCSLFEKLTFKTVKIDNLSTTMFQRNRHANCFSN